MTVFQHLRRGLGDLIHASSLPHADLRRRLGSTVTLTLAVAAVATIALLLVERGRPGSDIHSLWDAFYFTASQLTTLSSALANPVTRAGQVIVLLLDIYAITVVSTLAGMFGAFFYHRTEERRQAAARGREPS